MIATVLLLAYLRDSLIIKSSDRLFQFLFPLHHLYNLLLKKQRAILLSYLLFLLFPGQSGVHGPLAMHCQCPSKIMSISICTASFLKQHGASDAKSIQKNLSSLCSNMMLHCTNQATKQKRSGYFRVLAGGSSIPELDKPTSLRNVGF